MNDRETTANPALDRLTNISSSAASVVNSSSYTLDSTGRRTARQDADGGQISWGYDAFDQLTSASRTNGSNGAFDAAYNFAYSYDLVGNHLQEKRGPSSDALGRQLVLDGTHNNLNQITARDWSGKLALRTFAGDSSLAGTTMGSVKPAQTEGF